MTNKNTVALLGLLHMLAGCTPKPASTPPVTNYPPYLLVVTPRGTIERTPFNKQPDGKSGFSVTGKGFDPQAVIVANGQKLETVFGNWGWLTSSMPKELYEKAGVVKIKVLNSNGKESNAFDFKVTPAK
jgi:hypothetical protein